MSYADMFSVLLSSTPWSSSDLRSHHSLLLVSWYVIPLGQHDSPPYCGFAAASRALTSTGAAKEKLAEQATTVAINCEKCMLVVKRALRCEEREVPNAR
jgi:hypothetical protein